MSAFVDIRKVLISDRVDGECENVLKSHRIEVINKCGLSATDLVKALEDCDGLIVRSDTKVTKEIIEAAKSLKVIGRAGTGVDNIDVEAATRKGIVVLNAPNGNSISACELACSFMLCLARNVIGGCQSMKEEKWDRKTFAGGSELAGKTLAIIGLGRIGKEVAVRMRSYGMQIVSYDPFLTNEEADRYSIKLLQLEEIWPIADYISVHTPLIPQTKNLINQSVFAKCKRGVRIVNAARGGIVNESDLLTALKDGSCAGAALDVFSEEPPRSELLSALISHPRVIATPHIGASTAEAQTRVAVEVAEAFGSLKDFTSSYRPEGILNAPTFYASREKGYLSWFHMSQLLGYTLSRIARGASSLKGASITISLTGDIKNKEFLSTPLLFGILSGNIKNGCNYINTPIRAKEAGINFAFKVEESEYSCPLSNVVNIFAESELLPSISVRGTVIDRRPYLIKVNDAEFDLAPVRLDENLQIYSTEPNNVDKAISAIISWNETIENFSVGYGKMAWIFTRGKMRSELPIVPNIQRY